MTPFITKEIELFDEKFHPIKDSGTFCKCGGNKKFDPALPSDFKSFLTSSHLRLLAELEKEVMEQTDADDYRTQVRIRDNIKQVFSKFKE